MLPRFVTCSLITWNSHRLDFCAILTWPLSNSETLEGAPGSSHVPCQSSRVNQTLLQGILILFIGEFWNHDLDTGCCYSRVTQRSELGNTFVCKPLGQWMWRLAVLTWFVFLWIESFRAQVALPIFGIKIEILQVTFQAPFPSFGCTFSFSSSKTIGYVYFYHFISFTLHNTLLSIPLFKTDVQCSH